MKVKPAAWLTVSAAAAVALSFAAAPHFYPRLPLYVRSALRERAILSQAKQAPFGALIIGDSIVESANIPRDLCGVSTLNAGIGGARISDIARVAPSLLKVIRPQKIVFAIGINDALVDDSTSVESFRQDYLRTLAAARKGGGRIYVATIAPVGSIATTKFDLGRINEFNQVIRSLGVNVINLEKLAGPDGLLPAATTDDGVHLRPNGYEVWRAALEQGCAD